MYLFIIILLIKLKLLIYFYFHILNSSDSDDPIFLCILLYSTKNCNEIFMLAQ